MKLCILSIVVHLLILNLNYAICIYIQVLILLDSEMIDYLQFFRQM